MAAKAPEREREPRREIVLDVVVIDGNNSILQNEDACCLVHAMPLMSANERRGRIYLGTCSSVIRRVEPSPCFMCLVSSRTIGVSPGISALADYWSSIIVTSTFV